MARPRLLTDLCQAQVACDGTEIAKGRTICHICKDKIQQRKRMRAEYERIQAQLAAAERNGRRGD